jgi:putative transcriptional regulator
MIQINPTDLLIAPPNMPDPRFQEAVLMVLSDNESGTLALCLNKPTKMTLGDIPEVQDPNDPYGLHCPINWGGPMARESVWLLHDDQWSSENTMEVGEGYRVSSDLEMLEAIKQGECPEYFRMFTGFASWAPGQLRAELEGQGRWDKNHAWLVTQAPDIEWLMECPEEDLWTQVTALCAQQTVESWLN